MLHIIRERMKTFAYVHQTGRMQILGTMLLIHKFVLQFTTNPINKLNICNIQRPMDTPYANKLMFV